MEPFLKSTSLNFLALVCGLPGEEEEEGRGFVVVMLFVLSFSMVLALWYLLRCFSSCNGNSVLIWSLWTWTQLK